MPAMAQTPTQSDQTTTALALLHQFVDTPSYRALAAEHQCHVQEAIENLTRFEEGTHAVAAASFDEVLPERSAAEIRPASRGEFTDDRDVN